jgi:uncharacterized protein YcbK (DUF882 family)
MRPRMKQPRRTRRRSIASRWFLLTVTVSLFVARDAPARTLAVAHIGLEMLLSVGQRPARVASWAAMLDPIDVASASTGASASIFFYDRTGEVDDNACLAFERIAAREPEPHPLARRVEQLVFKAAYHFGAKHVQVVSGWREHAGKHSTGEAVDFRLYGVRPWEVAGYLRGLARVGVGVYTHPDTQFVHVDVRDPSYHWIDASPPGVHWKERQLGDRWAAKRDAAYDPDADLP